MSLKAFHLLFITAATVMAFACAALALKNYWSAGGRFADLAFGLVSLLLGGGLILYERLFLKKLKKASYL